MKEYMLLFRGGLDFNQASPEQLQDSMMKWQQWIAAVKENGKWAHGARLVPGQGKMMHGSMEITDGPFAEVNEIVGGYVAIHATDLDDAVATAKDCPIFIYGGTTEVREIAMTN